MALSRRSSRGTALLAVLWLTAALSAIAMAVADTVRSEALRSISSGENLKSYYLARGAIEQMLFRFHDPTAWSTSIFDQYRQQRRIYMREPEGDVLLEFVSEHSKLSTRSLNPMIFTRILIAIGETPEKAEFLTQQVFSTDPLPISQFSGARPTFRAPVTSIENVEEFLNFPGMTPEIVYGRYRRLADGTLVNAGGLVDCLAKWGAPSAPFDAAGVHPALLVAFGADPVQAQAFADQRRTLLEPSAIVASPLAARLPIKNELSPVFTVRATARVRLQSGVLSETRRTIALKVLYIQPDFRFPGTDPWSYLRWYDQADSEFAATDIPWMKPMPQGTTQ